MATEVIRTRRRFRGAWDEIEYLYQKVLYWFYQREDRRHALRFGERLERLLEDADPQQEAIKGQECRALLGEVRGALAQAVRHREKEIRLIERLWAISSGTPGKDYPLQDYGPEDLGDRLDLLAILYHDVGDVDRAIETLRRSRRLCAEHHIAFDGQDLLRDYLAEQKAEKMARRAYRG